MELRSMPETKQLFQDKLGNIWKQALSPIFRHFVSWKLSVQQTKQREVAYQIAKRHQYVTVTLSNDFFIASLINQRN